jgi:hypothetical protein
MKLSMTTATSFFCKPVCSVISLMISAFVILVNILCLYLVNSQSLFGDAKLLISIVIKKFICCFFFVTSQKTDICMPGSGVERLRRKHKDMAAC